MNTLSLAERFTAPLDVQDIMQLLPQRYPFLLVDRVLDYVPGETLIALKNVSCNEPFFEGHFPGNPVMPGVLIIEALAQAAGILGFLSVGRTPADGYVYLLAGADRARFRRKVVPGDQLTLKVKLSSAKRGLYKFACQALVTDQIAAEADVLIIEQALSDQPVPKERT